MTEVEQDDIVAPLQLCDTYKLFVNMNEDAFADPNLLGT